MTNPKEALEWHERRNEVNMGITDELRKYASGCAGGMGGDALRHIADRIDAEHKKQVTDAFTKGAINGIDMAEHSTEYVKLPVDADGVPIRVGDVVDVGMDPRNNFTVAFVAPDEIAYADGVGDLFTACSRACRHHHQPTVEGVLTELEGMRGNGATYEDVVTRCAELAETLRELLAKEDE